MALGLTARLFGWLCVSWRRKEFVLLLRTHKIRLNPTPEQEQWLLKACGVARFAYNWGLEQWQRQYKAGGKPSAYALKKQFNTIRREQFPWTYEVTKNAVDTGFRNLDAAFKNFFRRVKNGETKVGYPRFKSRKRSKLSFRMDGARVKTSGHWVKLEKLNEPINMAEELRFDGRVVSVTISRSSAGHWYAAFNVEAEPRYVEHPLASVGIDLGIKTLAVLSDGQRFENQEPLRSELRKLKRLNRELSRRQRGSNRWKRTRKRLARLHQRIRNRRLDYIHKVTTHIARTYALIGLEDLNVSGMLKNHHLALSVSDASFREFRRQLEYKAEWYGGQVVVVNRFFPSSKTCSVCGCINDDLTLSDRMWTCPHCGTVHDRDLNAARNIERQALLVSGRGGFADTLNGRRRRVRPPMATPDETSKAGAERTLVQTLVALT